MFPILALGFLLAGPGQTAPPALRVVVIAGEDGVNIIQQKTAVRPIVEVRDRNNLPVPGAVVTFSIQGGQAAFGGASTLTVATNAAGQAAVTGLTPSAAGAFQIQVSAAFQGQVATATIAQTNVLNAAQAAAASAASGGGTAGSAGGGTGGGTAGAGGAGSGLSATTIAVAGAAVAGGAVAATQIGGQVAGKVGGKVEYTGSFSGTILNVITSNNGANTCTYTRSIAATARLRLDENGDALRGAFEYTGTDTVVASTCQVPATPPTFIGMVEVSGSASQLSGRNTFPITPGTGMDGGTINGEQTLTFEGARSGDTVTGMFTHQQRTQSTGGATPGGIQSAATGSFAVTLQKP